MSGLRTARKAQTRQRIIAAAMDVYAEQGFAAPTSAVAERAEVSHGSVFAHFGSSDELLDATVESFSAAVGLDLHTLSEAGDDIAELLSLHLDVLADHEPFYRRLVKESAQLPESTRHALVAMNSTVSFHFWRALEADIASGRVKDLPFHLIFNTWLGLVHYYLLNDDLFAPDGQVLAHHKNALVACFTTLIETQTTPRKAPK